MEARRLGVKWLPVLGEPSKGDKHRGSLSVLAIGKWLVGVAPRRTRPDPLDEGTDLVRVAPVQALITSTPSILTEAAARKGRTSA